MVVVGKSLGVFSWVGLVGQALPLPKEITFQQLAGPLTFRDLQGHLHALAAEMPVAPATSFQLLLCYWDSAGASSIGASATAGPDLYGKRLPPFCFSGSLSVTAHKATVPLIFPFCVLLPGRATFRWIIFPCVAAVLAAWARGKKQTHALQSCSAARSSLLLGGCAWQVIQQPNYLLLFALPSHQTSYKNACIAPPASLADFSLPPPPS